MKFILALAALPLAACAQAATLDPEPVSAAQAPMPLPVRIVGRVAREAGTHGASYRRQWPGTYFETGVTGERAYFSVGEGDVILHLQIDGQPAGTLVRPRPGLYRIRDLGPGAHRLRVQVASESQAGATVFGGFFAADGARAAKVEAPVRQIEFIGDSYTVGYANRSSERSCSETTIWETTDTTRGVPALTAARFGADYQANAVSGRGVVRNYGGFDGDTLPQLYPYVTFAKAQHYDDAAWRPRVIVIGLGTNDFSTPLHAGEKWATREALHADYEARFIRFVADLRARNPDAYFLLWAAEPKEGEIMGEVARVADLLHARGETRATYVPVPGLDFSACNFHPSLADDARIADALAKAIEARPGIWDEPAKTP